MKYPKSFHKKSTNKNISNAAHCIAPDKVRYLNGNRRTWNNNMIYKSHIHCFCVWFGIQEGAMVAMEIDVPGVSAATYTQDIQLASHCSVTYMHANSLTACMHHWAIVIPPSWKMAYTLFTLYNNGVPCIYNVPNNLWELCDVQFFFGMSTGWFDS